MKTTLDDNILTLYPEGRIDTNNAIQIEKEALAAVEASPGADIVIDAKDLKYISSAGLRVLMKLRKQTGEKLPVLNVSSEIYEIFETTGFTNLFDVSKALRELSVDGCEIIGRGGFGIVYRLDPETVVKVYREGVGLDQLQEEKRCATTAFVHDLPTAIAYDTVRVGNSYGNVYELLNAVTVGKAVCEDNSLAEDLGRKMGRLIKKIHETEIEPGVLPRISDRFRARIDYIEEHHLSHEDAALLRQVVDAVPEKDTLVHGDFHEGNVMVQNGELLLIDLDSICVGNPIYDYISSYGLRKICVNGAYDISRQSLNLEPELIPVMDKYERQEFLGSDDPAVLDRFVQIMELFSEFRQILVLALEQSNRNMKPEFMENIKKNVVPVFREKAAEVIETAKNLDSCAAFIG